MQLKELNTRGYEVILVTSGAVGLGRQRLRYRRLANSRFFLLNLSYALWNLERTLFFRVTLFSIKCCQIAAIVAL